MGTVQGCEHSLITEPTEESKTPVKLSSFFAQGDGHPSWATLQESRSESLSSNTSPYYIRATGLYGTIIDEDVSKFVGQIIFVAGNVDLSDLAIQPRGQKLAVLEYYALFTALGGVQTQETTEFQLPNLSDLQTLNGPAIKPYISLAGTFGPDYYESYLSEIQLLALPQVPSGMYACDGSVYLNRAAPMLAAVLDNPAAGDPKAFQLPYLSHRDGLPYTIVASGEALFPG